MLARLRRALTAAEEALPAARTTLTAAAKSAPLKKALHTSSKLLKDLKTESTEPAKPLTPEQIAAIAAARTEKVTRHVKLFANEFGAVTAETVRDGLMNTYGLKKLTATIGGRVVMAAAKRAGAHMLDANHMTTQEEVARVLKHPDAIYGNPGAFERLATPMSEGGRYSQILVDKDGHVLNNGHPVVFTMNYLNFVLTETRNGSAWKKATPIQKAFAALALAGEHTKAKENANVRLPGANPLDKKALAREGNPKAAAFPMWKRPFASVPTIGERLGVLEQTTPAPKR